MMTFKQFLQETFQLPGRAISGLISLLLGATYINEAGEKERFRGVFGLTVDSTQYVLNSLLVTSKNIARGIANFVTNHKTAISAALWSALIVAGAAALTVAFWPAALTAVAGFAIGGISIASLFGAGFTAQIAAISAVAAVLTSAAVFAVAAVVNTCAAIKNFFVNRRKPIDPTPENPECETPEVNPTTNPLSALSNDNTVNPSSTPVEACDLQHHRSLFSSNSEKDDTSEEVIAPSFSKSA